MATSSTGSNRSPAPVDESAPTASDASGSTGVMAVPDSPLVGEHGTTSIADVVVSKIAGTATREVRGVHRVGGGTARALGAIRERIPGQKVSLGQGISVEVGQRQAAVDLVMVVEYGHPIVEVADEVRARVIESIERLTGLQVTEVNISVDDVHLPDEDDDEDESGETRVQ